MSNTVHLKVSTFKVTQTVKVLNEASLGVGLYITCCTSKGSRYTYTYWSVITNNFTAKTKLVKATSQSVYSSFRVGKYVYFEENLVIIHHPPHNFIKKQRATTDRGMKGSY